MTLAANTLKNDFANRRLHFGRNQIKKKNMDSFARANIVAIAREVDVTFRHHKILDPSWSTYLPNVPHSFFL